MISSIRLPAGLRHGIAAAAAGMLNPPGGRAIDFGLPLGEDALLPPDSMTWQVFKNPIALFVGGVAAVILELAEPAVRAGVWEHSSFRTDPIGRLRRTGLAAMVTVYAARSISVPMIANVVRMHARVTGATSAGASYSANDVALLSWVQATASFGFATAYSRYVRPLDRREFDAFYGEARPAARLYGALDSPASHAELHALLDSMLDRLEPSPVIFDFLRIMRDTPAIPTPFFRWLQRPLIRAAVEMIPHPIRERLGLGATHGLRPAERVLVRLAGAAADRMVLRECPASQSCLRLGLPANYLYA